MKNILVLYHADLDGVASAACVGLKYPKEKITYRHYNYGWPLEEKDFYGYDIVYAVDVSFSDHPWVYTLPGLVWIDHHKTALEYESANPWMKNIPGLRKIGKGACEFTWEYLFPDVECPELVKYLSAYDVWDKTRFPWVDTLMVEYGSKHIFSLSPVKLIDFLKANGNLEELKKIGRILLSDKEKTGRSNLYNNGLYIHDFFGMRAMLLNTSSFSSLAFSSYYNPEYFDVMIPFQISPDKKVRVSFYTENPDIDVSIVAEHFGGGGHKGAAGGMMSLEELYDILSNSVSLKTHLDNIGFNGNLMLFGNENKE